MKQGDKEVLPVFYWLHYNVLKNNSFNKTSKNQRFITISS